MNKPSVTREKNHLSQNFFIIPETMNQLFTTRELRETLLATNGQFIAKGVMWTIESKRVGPGVYRTSAKRKVYA